MAVRNLAKFCFKVGFRILSGPNRGAQNGHRFRITLGQSLAPRVTSYSYLGPGEGLGLELGCSLIRARPGTTTSHKND